MHICAGEHQVAAVCPSGGVVLACIVIPILHAYIHVCIRIHTCMYTYTNTYMYVFLYIHAYTHVWAQRTRRHALDHACLMQFLRTSVHTLRVTRKQRHRHIHRHRHRHGIHTHTQTQTQTQTHRHTHTRISCLTHLCGALTFLPCKRSSAIFFGNICEETNGSAHASSVSLIANIMHTHIPETAAHSLAIYCCKEAINRWAGNASKQVSWLSLSASAR